MVISTGKKTTFKNIEEIIVWANKIRPEMKKLAEEKMNKNIAQAIMHVVSDIYLYKKIPKNFNLVFSKRYNEDMLNPKYSLGLQAEGEIYSAAKYDACSSERNPDVDFRSELVVIPYKGEFYAIWYGEDKSFKRFVDSQPELQDFWYDGRIDEPEDMEYEEYSAIGDIWNDIFKEYWKPTEVGVVINLLPEIPLVQDENKIAEIMTRQRSKVVREIATYHDDSGAHAVWLNANPENQAIYDKAKEEQSITAYLEYKKWVVGDGKDIIEEYVKKHENTFPSANLFKDIIKKNLSEAYKLIIGKE